LACDKFRGSWANNGPSEVIRVSSTSMAIRRFSPFASTAKPKGIKTRDALDVAARYFVYKLYDATRRDRIKWVPLSGIDESQATIERAVERGWAILQRQPGGSPRQSEAALTDEGRRLARAAG
jgi:hypothetical protein